MYLANDGSLKYVNLIELSRLDAYYLIEINPKRYDLRELTCSIVDNVNRMEWVAQNRLKKTST